MSSLGCCPALSLQELRDAGYLQEVNRRFFHPLGLALAIRFPDGNGSGGYLEVVDSRDDPEGVRFEGISLAEKADAVNAEWERRFPARRSALGYMVQPAHGD